jgi:hypothetical protein
MPLMIALERYLRNVERWASTRFVGIIVGIDVNDAKNLAFISTACGHNRAPSSAPFSLCTSVSRQRLTTLIVRQPRFMKICEKFSSKRGYLDIITLNFDEIAFDKKS